MARFFNSPWPIANLLSSLLGVFIISVLLIFAGFASYILWQSTQLQERTEQVVFDSVRSELEIGYLAMKGLLEDRNRDFLQVHEQALNRLQSDGPPADLGALQEELQAMIGIPLDIYLIDADLTVNATTYPPDEGLDFSHPALLDGRVMIERALQSGEIVVGAPVLEVVARQFRVYTYSPLGDDGRVLELGFVSPILNDYFRQLEARMEDREIYSATLHFLMWDDWLLSLRPDRRDDQDKQDLLDAHYERQAEQIDWFRQARDSGLPVEVKRDDRGREYVFHVVRIESEDTWDMDILARVHVKTDLIGGARTGLMIASLLVLLLLGTIALGIFLFARKALAIPLTAAAAAIEQWQPIRLEGIGTRLRELQLLASHYNGMLDTARSRIRGLNREVRTDSLTGLSNRFGLESELDVELRRTNRYHTPFSIILLDLDHFKDVNDRHGHLHGDQVLRKLANILRKRSRSSDSVSRWGGEEFLILCRDTSQEQATELAEKLRDDVQSIPTTGSEPCTASFGVAGFQAGDDMESLFGRADRALYRAKRNGRNRVESEPEPSRQ